MTTLVLVHSPLVGPATWAGVAAHLEALGHATVVPSLLAATGAGPPFAGPQVEVVAAAVSASRLDGPFVLVAHSGAGSLLPAIGAALAGRVTSHLFVDAALPSPGRSRLDELHPSVRGHLRAMVDAGGMLPPWHEWWGPGSIDHLVPDPAVRERVVAELQPIAFALLEEPLPVVEGWPSAPCGYLRLSAAYVAEEATAGGLGWPVSTLAGTHLELVTAPERVAAAVLDLSRRSRAG